MDIGKSKDNYDKDRKPRCFNYNIYRYIARDCQKPKKEKETRKHYKCDKVRYLVKNCRSEQKESDKENNDRKKSFVGDSE